MKVLSRNALLLLGGMACAAAGLPSSAVAEILLAPGDKLSLHVIGVQELGTVATIEMDGTVKLPIVGRMRASGLTADGLQAEIAGQLSQEPIRMPGRNDDTWLKLEPSKIFVTVAEFRPVYASGAVQTGGEIAFRPGMTARHVLVVAGGLGQDLGTTSAVEVARVISDRYLVSKQIELAKHEIARLEAELAEIEKDILLGAGGTVRIEETGLSSAEDDWMDARSQRRGLNEDSADKSIEQMRERLEVLLQLEKVNDETLEAYELEYARMLELSNRGVATVSSSQEAQRGVLTASGRALETISESYKVRIDIARASDASQLDLATEQIDTLTALLRETDRLKDLEARLDALSVRQSLLVGGGTESGPVTVRVVIHRGSGDTAERIDATLDTVVAPGDVVDFSW